MECVPTSVAAQPENLRKKQDSNFALFNDSDNSALLAHQRIGIVTNVASNPVDAMILVAPSLKQQDDRVLSLKQIASLDSHQAEIKDFIFSQSDNMLISADVSGYIYFWSILNNQVTFKYRQHANKRLVCFFKTHLKHSIGVHNSEGDISCFSVSHKVYHNPKYFKPNCSSILMTKTPYKCFVVGTNSGEVLIHQINTNDTVRLQAHRARINGFVITAEGFIYSISDDREILVICLREKVIKARMQGHRDRITSICHIPELGLLITVGADSLINIWNLRSHTLQKIIYFPKSIVAIGVLSDVNFLVIGTSSYIFIVDWKRESIVRRVEILCDKLVVDIVQRRIYTGHGKKIIIFKIPKDQKLLIEMGLPISNFIGQTNITHSLANQSEVWDLSHPAIPSYSIKESENTWCKASLSKLDSYAKDSHFERLHPPQPPESVNPNQMNLKRIKESFLMTEISSKNSELVSTHSLPPLGIDEAEIVVQKCLEPRLCVKPLAKIQIGPILTHSATLKSGNDLLGDIINPLNLTVFQPKSFEDRNEVCQDLSDPKRLTIRLPDLYTNSIENSQNQNEKQKMTYKNPQADSLPEKYEIGELERETFLSPPQSQLKNLYNKPSNLNDQKFHNLIIPQPRQSEIQNEWNNQNPFDLEIKKKSRFVGISNENCEPTIHYKNSLTPDENLLYHSQSHQTAQELTAGYITGKQINIIRHAVIEKESIFLGTCLLCQQMRIRTLFDTQGQAYKLFKGDTSYVALGICPQYSGNACIMFSDNSSCELKIENLHFSPEQTTKSFVFYFGPEHKRYTLIWCPKYRLFRDVNNTYAFFYIDPCRGRVTRYLFK